MKLTNQSVWWFPGDINRICVSRCDFMGKYWCTPAAGAQRGEGGEKGWELLTLEVV